MDLSKYRFRATFEATANITRISDEGRKVATASLAPLRSLLPPDIDPANDPDLLYLAANGATAGLCNKNLDAVSNQTGLRIHASCRNKYINVDHEKGDICGVILYPGLSRFGTNEPLTEEEASTLKEPFNMAFAGVIWKAVNPMIAGYISKQKDTDKEQLSMSWEILFNEYNIGVGSRNIFEARVLTPEDPSFAVYDKKLYSNGGSGKDDKGQEVYRIITGDAILLGYSIVRNPAAEVKGILPITEKSLEESLQNAVSPIAELSEDQLNRMASIVKESIHNDPSEKQSAEPQVTVQEQKIEEKNQNSTATSVTTNTAPKIMKIENLEQLEATLAKHEATAAVVDFVKAIQSASEQFSKDLQAKEDLVKNAEQAKAELEKLAQKNEKRAEELEASLAAVRKELAEVRAAQEAAEADRKFQDRMASFDEAFELDAEDRKLIASDIKDLDDAAFDAYAAKCNKLMAAKKKKSKSEMDEEKMKEEEEEEEEECEKAKKAKAAAEAAASEEAAKAKAALASVQEINGQKVVNTVVVDEDLKARMASAFGESILIDGKTVAQRKAAKAKKEEKK